ncbi:MAG: hypothetical protein RJA22_1301 [Verrucomicrobiota bacterium]
MKIQVLVAFSALAMLGSPSPLAAQAPAQPRGVDPVTFASEEAVRRQVLRRELDAKLAEAIATEKRGSMVEAARLYTECVELTKRIGPGIDDQQQAALGGFLSTRMHLAEMAQRMGDYAAADAQYVLLLKEDPKNETLKKLKARNDELRLANAGRRPPEADIAALPAIYTNQVQSAELAQAGKLYLEAGRHDLAEAKLRQALKLDPSNSGADYYLKMVLDKKMAAGENALDVFGREAILAVETSYPQPKNSSLPVPNPYTRTNVVRTSKQRERLYHKLDSIVLGDLSYDGLQLNQVLEMLGKDVVNRDPEKKGINIILAPNADPQPAAAAPAVDPATGLPVAQAGGGGEGDLTATTIRLTAKGLTLRQALDVIVKVADRPIKYSVEDFGVMFSPRGNETPALHTRWFRIDPNTFANGLQGVVSMDFGGNLGGGGGGGGGFGGGGGGFGGGRGGGGRGNSGGGFGGGSGGFGGQGGGGSSAEYASVSVAPSGGNRGGGFGGQQRGGAAGPGQQQGGGAAAGQQGGINFLTAQTPMDITVSAVLAYFRTAGVPLDPPKSVHFNDRLGLLMVRATLADLDLIEQAVQVLNTTPPQVLIEAKLAEVTQTDTRALGFDWLLGNTLSFNGKVGTQGGTAPSFNGQPTAANPSGVFPGPLPPGSAPGTTTPGTLPPAATDNVITSGLRNSAPAVATVTGILTDPQFRVVIRALEQRQGISVVATPSIMTPSGRQAQLKTVEVRTIVTDLDASQTGGGGGGNLVGSTGSGGVGSLILPISQPFELGPTLDVVPYVSADGVTIQLTLIPAVKEFVGYDLDSAQIFAAQIQSVSGNSTAPPLIQPTPLPIFRLRQVVTSAIVWDGQTVALGGLIADSTTKFKDKVPVLGDLPWVGRVFRSESTASTKKNLMIFVTPTIVDPAGNRMNTDADMPFAQSSIPPQRPVAQ